MQRIGCPQNLLDRVVHSPTPLDATYIYNTCKQEHVSEPEMSSSKAETAKDIEQTSPDSKPGCTLRRIVRGTEALDIRRISR